MRTIIAGSRDVESYAAVVRAVECCGWHPTVVLSGKARGVDRLGEQWAHAHKVPIEQYPAQWDIYGTSAGYRRNEQMAKHAEALIAVWDGKSRGTRHMIDLARKYKLRVHVELV